jgi:hypothetical protein
LISFIRHCTHSFVGAIAIAQQPIKLLRPFAIPTTSQAFSFTFG